jgi:tRNA pseudouridine55 synthase
VTSHDVVARVRRERGRGVKVGHAGTLDPFATGLLLVLVGHATRAQRFLMGLPKTYRAVARLGWTSDTGDRDGELVRTGRIPERLEIPTGELMQRPPAYSAVKVGGRKLYEAAREGRTLEAPPRPIHVERFSVRAFDGSDVEFVVTCSGGTYVRVLLADVGTALGCGAHLRRLRRVAIGSYRVEDAVAPVDVRTPSPVEAAVAHLPRLDLSPEEAVAARHGRILAPGGIVGPYGVFDPDGALVGIYEDEGAKARPRVILPR